MSLTSGGRLGPYARAGIVVAAVLVALPARLAAQQPVHPSFAGDWVRDPSRSSSGTPAGQVRAGGAGTTASAPATAAPGPVRVGGAVHEPALVKRVPPIYPREAQQAGISGIVIVEAIIAKDGRVANVKVVRSVPGLDDAAREAVSQWEYSPTLLNGEPVEVVFTVTVTFYLGGPGGAPASPGFGGRGSVGAPAFTIKQDDRNLKIVRTASGMTETITYRLDGKAIKNKLLGAPTAGEMTFVSHWDADRLVTRIVSSGPRGLAQRIETLSLDGDALVIRSVAIDPATGAEGYTQTSVYTKKK